MTDLGDNAFDSCVLLERVSMSRTLRAQIEATDYGAGWSSTDPFFNCPLLSIGSQGTQGVDDAAADLDEEKVSDESLDPRRVVASPNRSG